MGQSLKDKIELLAHQTRKIYVRQFVAGASLAGKSEGVSVIIDNFRASNTILALLEAGATVKPVSSVEEALQHDDFLKVGEDSRSFDLFDYDNSPTNIDAHHAQFANKNVVIRTTNGTQGLVNAVGSHQILVGSFRNHSRVVEHCLKKYNEGYSISFVAMGSELVPRIEDIYGAKMMYYSLLKALGEDSNTDDNPFQKDWVNEIKKVREFDEVNGADRTYAVKLDHSHFLPLFNPQTGYIEVLD